MQELTEKHWWCQPGPNEQNYSKRKRNSGIRKQKDNINEKINQTQRAIDEEINGTGGTRQKGIGIRTKQKMEIVKQLESEEKYSFNK